MDCNRMVGRRIEIIRKERNETQQQLAEALGVKREQIAYWEAGTREIKALTLLKIADRYNVSADYLLGRTTVKSPETDLQAVCQYLGLSEKAVIGLRQAKEPWFFQLLSSGIDIPQNVASSAHSVMEQFLEGEESYTLFLYLAAIRYGTDKAEQAVKLYRSSSQKDNFIESLKSAERAIKLSFFELTENAKRWANQELSNTETQIALALAINEIELNNVKQELNMLSRGEAEKDGQR